MQVQSNLAPQPGRDFSDFLRFASVDQLKDEQKRLHQAVQAIGPNVRSNVRDTLDSQLRELRCLRAQLSN